MRTLALAFGLSLLAVSCNNLAESDSGGGTDAMTASGPEWIELFDGKTLAGWEANENPTSWSIRDGAIVANGNRSHLFYTGDPEPFVDFELEAVIMTRQNSNSGVYIHTKYQDNDWPKYGFEVQVNNTYKDPQKTAGLYDVAKVLEAPAKDDTWFTLNVRVEGKHIVTKVDGKVITDYTEPPDAKAGSRFTRVVDKGTFALQAHDPGSTVLYKSIKVRRI